MLFLFPAVSGYPNIYLYRLGKTLGPVERNQVGAYMLNDPRWNHWNRWVRAYADRVKMETYSAICLIYAEELTDTLRKETGETR